MRRFRLRPRRLTVLPVLIGCVFAVALYVVKQTKPPPPWLSWCPSYVLGMVAIVLAALAEAVRRWNKRRQAEVDADRKALAEFNESQGERSRYFPRLGDREADSLTLGVHRSIRLDEPDSDQRAASSFAVNSFLRRLPGRSAKSTRNGRDAELPTFVDRDIGPRVKKWMKEARNIGGFLILTGNSSVGKTRLLYESAREVLSDFSVLAPDHGDGRVVNSLAGAAVKLPPLIIWLDELHYFLTGPQAITAKSVRQLINAPSPVILLGAMWTEDVTRLRSVKVDADPKSRIFEFPDAADILANNRIHEETLSTFSESERQAAEKLAGTDVRLARALEDHSYNVTEVLAGAPVLDRRYDQGTEEQRVILNAAVDARRLGIKGPLSVSLLRAAARGYLISAHADDNWFAPAVAELTENKRPQDRAVAPLVPLYSSNRRRVIGYTAADYLLQRLLCERRCEQVPAIAWTAFIKHTRGRDDLMELANSAYTRLLFPTTERILRLLAEKNDGEANEKLVTLLAARENIDELRDLAEAGNKLAAQKLSEVASGSDLEKLQEQAHAGDRSAADRLAIVAANRGNKELLRAQADANGTKAGELLAELLADRGDLAELRVRANSGDAAAQMRLAWLLARKDELDEVRTRADSGDLLASYLLMDVLAGRGEIDELKARADRGDAEATRRYTDVLIRRGQFDNLHKRASNGDITAEFTLATVLTERGDLGELQARADAADDSARDRLAVVLADREELEQLRRRADAEDDVAARRLAQLLLDRDDFEHVKAWAEASPNFIAARNASAKKLRGAYDRKSGSSAAARTIADFLLDRGELEQLRDWADTGNTAAARRWSQFLLACGDLEQLKRRADSRDHSAADALANWLAAQTDSERNARPELEKYSSGYLISNFTGRPSMKMAKDSARFSSLSYARELARILSEKGRLGREITEARIRADGGDEEAGALLAALLAVRDDMPELRARADMGDRHAKRRLAEVLASRRDEDGLRARADAYDFYAAGRLADLLADQQDLDKLRARADAGDEDTARRLARMLANRRDMDELRGRADDGDRQAGQRLAEMLANRGDLDGLRARADARDKEAGQRLAEMLANRGDLDGLRARADAGDLMAARKLGDILAASEDTHGLVARADKGDSSAGYELARLLADRPDLARLRARADAGDWHAARMLARILVFRHDIGELRKRAEAGDRYAAHELLQTLAALRDKRAIEQEVTAGNSLRVRRIANIWQHPGANPADYQLRLRQGLVPEGSIDECLNGISGI